MSCLFEIIVHNCIFESVLADFEKANLVTHFSPSVASFLCYDIIRNPNVTQYGEHHQFWNSTCWGTDF